MNCVRKAQKSFFDPEDVSLLTLIDRMPEKFKELQDLSPQHSTLINFFDLITPLEVIVRVRF